MSARALVPLAVALALACGLWLALTEGDAPGPALAPGARPAVEVARADSSRAERDPFGGDWELVPHPVVDERAPGAPAPPAARPKPVRPQPSAREGLSFVEQPEPGAYDGPIARETFPSGALLFEGQQRRREDGVWILDGAWTAWHENGQVQEQGSYRDHREHGLWEWWDENGIRIARGEYEDGARTGPWTYWYEDGTKQMDAFYADGVGEGHWVLYHENGLKCAEGDFEGGEIAGRWTIWDENGAIDVERSGWFEAGAKIAD
jgi:hypothetical protein